MTRCNSRCSRALVLLALASPMIFAACGKKNAKPDVQTVLVTRRDIIVATEATGTVEPVDTVAVKSQASGLIQKMPIEIGMYVKPGDLIAQLDTRNLNNDYQRALAAERAARSNLTVNSSALRRANALFEQGVITAAERENAVVAEANARSALVAAQTNLRVARQNLEYATVRAEVAGTVISKNASVGTVASSALSNVGGGSTIVTIADLARVRMRVLVNETDIANVKVGQPAIVIVDALPNRQFQGVVEKIEPQAVVQQSVTMFPVLVSLPNTDRALLPGMNGQVSMETQRREHVLAVPVDALKTGRDLFAIAEPLGVSRDAIQQAMREGFGRGSATGGATGNENVQRTTRAGGGNFQFVLVKQETGFVPRAVQTGVTNYDHTEILNGLKEGEVVALLSTVVAQQQRDAQTERIRSRTTGGGPIPVGGGGRSR